MNIFENTTNLLGYSLANMLTGIINFLPSLLIALLLVILGFLFGGILGRAVSHLISILKIDQALKKVGFNNPNIKVAHILGLLTKWTVIISFVMTATEVLGLTQFTNFLQLILSYIPNVLVAALILVSTFLLADFVAKLVSHSASAAGVKGEMAGVVSKYAIVVVGVLAALAQLHIATGFMEILFTGVVASISLALGLAFGLGGRDAAARAVEKLENTLK